jgi:uncharacterized membrane protein
MGGGFIGMVLILFGIFVLALWRVRALFPNRDIARRRYAAGEIGKEEFEERERDLM